MKKTGKTLLSFFVSLLLLLTALLPAELGGLLSAETAQAAPYQRGDIITFGAYPQSRVTDSAILAALDAAPKSWISYGYYSGTGTNFDGNMQPGDWMRYADIPLDGAVYRAVTFDSYRPNCTSYQTSASTASTSEQRNNNYACGTVYYYKFEPLQWKVLDPETGLVLCLKAIDAQPFNNTIVKLDGYYWQTADKETYASNYEKSSLRQWLLNDFYNTAFSAAEQDVIGLSQLDNSAAYSTTPDYGSAATTDKIFLLSYDEAVNPAYGFPSSIEGVNLARVATGTEYAQCQGLKTSNITNTTVSLPRNCANWWLRTAAFSGEDMFVGDAGTVTYNDVHWSSFGGIRPAFRFEGGFIRESVNPFGGLPRTYGVGDLITYGGYPQSRVTDDDTLAALNAAPKHWQSYKYYSGTGHGVDGKMKPGDWMRYADITLADGCKYRAVTFDSYRPPRSGHETLVDASWEEQSQYGYTPGNIYYFRYESLRWRVLDPENGLVLCESAIDSQPYQNLVRMTNYDNYWNSNEKSAPANDYATSSLRQWLLNDFYCTAFSAAEQARIGSTPLNDSGGIADKIFLPSIDDVTNPAYGFSEYRLVDPAREAPTTDYAKSQGLDAPYYGSVYGSVYWWLRTPSPTSTEKAATVDSNSKLLDSAGNLVTAVVHNTSIGVRPAFRFQSGIRESLNPNGGTPKAYINGQILRFGRYPQRLVTDAATLDALEALPKNWVSYGYYSGSGTAADPQMQPGDWMKYADLTLGDERYRAVRIENNRPNNTYAALSPGNGNQAENGYAVSQTPYYFRYEPLEWVVLDSVSRLVLCRSIIDSQAFNDTYYKEGSDYWQTAEKAAYANNYALSSVRQWLNADFYNTAFTSEEQAVIGSTELVNDAYIAGYESETTNDKVFLLRYDDVNNQAYGFSSNADRACAGTDYALAQGLNVGAAGKSYWTLRTAATNSRTITSVLQSGAPAIAQATYMTMLGMRPAFCFGKVFGENDSMVESGRRTPYKTGDLIRFGGYPQSLVTSSNLKAALNAQPKDWKSCRYYSGAGSSADGQMQPGDWMRYADFMWNGTKYRAVTFDSYRPVYTSAPPGETETDSLQAQHGFLRGNIYYFKYDPLWWRVLDPDEGLVLCENVIDSQAFNNTVYHSSYLWQSADQSVYACDYEYSSIRQWLAEDFYNTAFSAKEQLLIAETQLDNGTEPDELPIFNPAPTTDKVFLLSWSDVADPAYGFSANAQDEDPARKAAGTAYAYCQGLRGVNTVNGGACWWLRSPTHNTDQHTEVNDAGRYSYGFDYNITDRGIRPAFRFKNGVRESINANGGVGSEPLVPLSILAQPKNITVAPGSTATFSVTAAGTCLTYRWRCRVSEDSAWVDSTDPGSNTDFVYFSADEAHNGRQYQCVVTDAGGNVRYTAIATLTLKALTITAQPKNLTAAPEGPASFSVGVTGVGVTYRWRCRTSKDSAWTNCTAVGSNTAQLSFTAKSADNGKQYQCVVTDAGGNVRYSAIVTLTVKALSITVQPKDDTAAPEGTAKFSIVAAGAGLTYRWRCRTSKDSAWANCTGAGSNTAQLSFTAKSADNGKQYQCVVTDAGGTVRYSAIATLTIKALAITAQPQSITAAALGTASFSVGATGVGITYRWRCRTSKDSAWVYTTASGSNTAQLSFVALSADDGKQYQCVVTDAGGNVRYSAIATLTVKTLAFTAQPQNLTVAPESMANFSVAVTGAGVTYRWRCRASKDRGWVNSTAAGSDTAQLSFTAKSGDNGKQYQCVVTDAGGTVRYSAIATLTVKALTFTAQPENFTAAPEGKADFSVGVTGVGVTYRWRCRVSKDSAWVNSTAAGSNTAQLSFTAKTADDGKQYQCVVTDAGGNVRYSAIATLTVKALAITAQPQNFTAAPGGAAKFSVTATGVGVTYRWRSRTSKDSAWENCTAAGSNTAQLSFTAKSADNGRQYQCIVTDAGGNVRYSAIATLTVK